MRDLLLRLLELWLLLTSGILIGSSTGVGRVVHYLFDIPVSYTVFAFNGILFLTGQMKAE
ncbi:hypothetical protein DW099_09370 [Emergencia timonensis]|uniref:Uncharacterized protein n=1 Tax=Emergencia timonensis TaxID=1776384 RepID=A0A415E4R4_9FIRM|nr:hypothetical protein DW099_09370 [Emergencia timonensis]